MPAPLSVIIPTLNVAQTIGPCLLALTEGISDGLLAEVIFADGDSTDDTAQIADEVGAHLIVADRGRGSQLAAGAETAKGEWLLFLHADSVLQDGWQAAVLQHMKQRDRAGYFRLRFDDTSSAAAMVARWANLRARLFGLPYGDQGLLIRRAHYDKIGGHPAIPLMEDVAIAKALRGQLRMLDCTILTSADKYQSQGWWRRSWRNFMLVARFKLGADPEKLAKNYR